jgi:hypothetical protein
MNIEKTTEALVAKLNGILERELTPMENTIVEYVVTQIKLDLLEVK